MMAFGAGFIIVSVLCVAISVTAEYGFVRVLKAAGALAVASATVWLLSISATDSSVATAHQRFENDQTRSRATKNSEMSVALLHEATTILSKDAITDEDFKRAHALVLSSLAHIVQDRFNSHRATVEPSTPGKTVHQVTGKRVCPDAPPRGILHPRHEDTSRGPEDGYAGASQQGTPPKRARAMNPNETDEDDDDSDDAASEHTAPLSRPPPSDSGFPASQNPDE